MQITIKRYKKNKHIKISIKEAGKVLVTYPWWVSRKQAEKFIQEKKSWIKTNLKKIEQTQVNYLLKKGGRSDYLKNKEKARKLVKKKLTFFKSYYQVNFGIKFTYQQVAIRNQRTRWGSCSAKGNLNFNWRIILLTETIQDYLIVHELCHLKQMNHSVKFWQLVKQAIPDYKKITKELRLL